MKVNHECSKKYCTHLQATQSKQRSLVLHLSPLFSRIYGNSIVWIRKTSPFCKWVSQFCQLMPTRGLVKIIPTKWKPCGRSSIRTLLVWSPWMSKCTQPKFSSPIEYVVMKWKEHKDHEPWKPSRSLNRSHGQVPAGRTLRHVGFPTPYCPWAVDH